MHFARQDKHHGVTLVTGPNFLTLWLALAEGERDPSPYVVQLHHPWCPQIDADTVRVAVLTGIDEANAKFGTKRFPLEIKFVMERPADSLLQTAAFRIIERLATVGEAGYVPPVVETKHGKIIAQLHGFQVIVRLEDGQEIHAVLSKRLVRSAFLLKPDDEADIVLKPPPKLARVVRLWRFGRPVG